MFCDWRKKAAPRPGFRGFRRFTGFRRGWWRLTPQILKKRGAAGAAGCVEGLHRFRSGGDSGSAAEGCGLPLCGNAYKVSVTGLTFSVTWQNNHSADWLAALATPYPGCAGLPPVQGAE